MKLLHIPVHLVVYLFLCAGPLMAAQKENNKQKKIIKPNFSHSLIDKNIKDSADDGQSTNITVATVLTTQTSELLTDLNQQLIQQQGKIPETNNDILVSSNQAQQQGQGDKQQNLEGVNLKLDIQGDVEDKIKHKGGDIQPDNIEIKQSTGQQKQVNGEHNIDNQIQNAPENVAHETQIKNNNDKLQPDLKEIEEEAENVFAKDKIESPKAEPQQDPKQQDLEPKEEINEPDKEQDQDISEPDEDDAEQKEEKQEEHKEQILDKIKYEVDKIGIKEDENEKIQEETLQQQQSQASTDLSPLSPKDELLSTGQSNQSVQLNGALIKTVSDSPFTLASTPSTEPQVDTSPMRSLAQTPISTTTHNRANTMTIMGGVLPGSTATNANQQPQPDVTPPAEDAINTNNPLQQSNIQSTNPTDSVSLLTPPSTQPPMRVFTLAVVQSQSAAGVSDSHILMHPTFTSSKKLPWLKLKYLVIGVVVVGVVASTVLVIKKWVKKRKEQKVEL